MPWCWERWQKKPHRALHPHPSLQNGGGKKDKKKKKKYDTNPCTSYKVGESNSSQAFKNSQVIFHMSIYWVYCYRGKWKPDPKVAQVIGHSQGRCSAFRWAQHNSLPWYLCPGMGQPWHSNSQQVDAAGYFSDQPAGISLSWGKNVRDHWPKASGFLKGW